MRALEDRLSTALEVRALPGPTFSEAGCHPVPVPRAEAG